MLKTTITFLLMLLLVAVSGQASADSSYYLTSQFTGSGNWTHDFTATPFDTSLGTLNSVTVSVDVDMSLASLQVENRNRNASVADAWVKVIAPFTVSLGTAGSMSLLPLGDSPAVTQTGISLAKFDGIYDYSGTSGHTYGYSAPLVSHLTYAFTSDQAALFFLPGSLLNITTDGFTYSSSPSTVVVPSALAFLKGATVSVTYDYTPVPVPGAVWLLGSGLLGLIGLRRKAFLPVLLLALFLGVSGQAWAMTYSDSYSLPSDLAGEQSWTWSQHFGAFNSALGTLDGVRLDLAGTMVMDLAFEGYDYDNADNPGVSYNPTYKFTQQIAVSYGSLAPALFGADPAIVKAIALGPIDYVQLADQSASILAGMTVAADKLMLFASGFTLNVFADFPTVFTADTLLPTLAGFDRIYDSLTLKVTYDFTPAPVPEPSAVWLFGSGAVCMAGALALRRRTKE